MVGELLKRITNKKRGPEYGRVLVPVAQGELFRYRTWRELYAPAFAEARRSGAACVEFLPGDWDDEWPADAQAIFWNGSAYTVLGLGEGYGVIAAYRSLEAVPMLDEFIRSGDERYLRNPSTYAEEFKLYRGYEAVLEVILKYGEDE